jgi:L-iditol 2-dehydrogenase
VINRMMKAARLYAPGDLRYEDTEVPDIRDGEVLVRVKAVGICGSDPARVMLKGTYSYPTTVGHEFAGEIVRVGAAVKSVQLKDRVTIIPLIPCGTCDYCAVGEYNLCDDYSYYGSRENGAMAEFIAVRERNLLKLPSGVDFESAACTDPISVALHAIRKAEIRIGDSVAVLGVGPIGQFAVQWARLMGARQILVSDIFDEKLSIARELGADDGVNAAQQDAVAFILEKTGGMGVDRVIEIAGSKVTQEQSIRMVKKQGRVIFCGISYDDLLLPQRTLDQLMRKEVTLVGAWNSSFSPLPVHEWQTSLHFMASGHIRCGPLISHRLPLSAAPDTFRRIWRRDEYFNKVLFMP